MIHRGQELLIARERSQRSIHALKCARIISLCSQRIRIGDRAAPDQTLIVRPAFLPAFHERFVIRQYLQSLVDPAHSIGILIRRLNADRRIDQILDTALQLILRFVIHVRRFIDLCKGADRLDVFALVHVCETLSVDHRIRFPLLHFFKRFPRLFGEALLSDPGQSTEPFRGTFVLEVSLQITVFDRADRCFDLQVRFGFPGLASQDLFVINADGFIVF